MISQGKPKSKQVETTSHVAMITGLGMMSSKNETVQTLGFASLILGIIGKIAQP